VENAQSPSTHAFSDPTYVARWEQNTVSKYPQRLAFFDAFVIEVSALDEGIILELGSGPGALAEQILSRCMVSRYYLVDSSRPMHDLARKRVGADVRAAFVQADFGTADWTTHIPEAIDAVVSMQAVHELGQPERVPDLYRQLRALCRRTTTLLICDHVRQPEDDRPRFLTADEHLGAMDAAGVSSPALLLTLGDLALFKGILHRQDDG
jgi:cyclopropane fatty-acyl-phospholipid synthase-like methyltransferase